MNRLKKQLETNGHTGSRGQGGWKTTWHADRDIGTLRTLATCHRRPFILLPPHPGLGRQESSQPSCSSTRLSREEATGPVPSWRKEAEVFYACLDQLDEGCFRTPNSSPLPGYRYSMQLNRVAPESPQDLAGTVKCSHSGSNNQCRLVRGLEQWGHL